MTTSQLETALNELVQAAAKFQAACDDYYREQRRTPNCRAPYPPHPQAQLNLQEKIRQITAVGTYSNMQRGAVLGAFSAWQPPQPKRVLSLPFENRARG